MTLLTILFGGGEAAVAPGVAIDFGEMFAANNDVGFHVLAADLSRNIAGADLLKRNILENDVGWKVRTSSVRRNIREG